MSLRLRVAVAAGVTSLIVAILAGGALLAFVRRDEARALDARLEQEVRLAAQRAATEVAPDRPRVAEVMPSERELSDLTAVARVRQGDEILVTLGDFPLADDQRPPLGFSTQEIDGVRWRLLATPAEEAAPSLAARVLPPDQRDSVIVEVAEPTAETDETVAGVRRLVVRLGIGALALAATGGWLLGGAALRPLARLRTDAERVRDADDPDLRVADDQGLREVDELGRALNDMLDRIRSANQRTASTLEASRAFAAHAAHELRTPLTSMQANLEVLSRDTDMDADTREQVLADVLAQERRLLRLLEALRLLARGDLTAVLPTDEISLIDLAEEAVVAARRRHPDATIDVRADQRGRGLDLTGWQEGLRVLLDNLLDNAAIHGRRPGRSVAIALALEQTEDAEVRLIVDDDGPGVAPGERERVLDRFTRGADAPAGGSGLGLALVNQQAQLHGGHVELSDSPTGGLRVVVALPVSGTGPRH